MCDTDGPGYYKKTKLVRDIVKTESKASFLLTIHCAKCEAKPGFFLAVENKQQDHVDNRWKQNEASASKRFLDKPFNYIWNNLSVLQANVDAIHGTRDSRGLRHGLAFDASTEWACPD